MTRAVETFEPAGEGLLFDDRLFAGFSALVGVLMVAGFVLFLWVLVRNLRLVRRADLDPVALDPRARAWQGHAAGQRAAPLAQRLQELDDLRSRGLITEAEHSLARHRALTGGQP